MIFKFIKASFVTKLCLSELDSSKLKIDFLFDVESFVFCFLTKWLKLLSLKHLYFSIVCISTDFSLKPNGDNVSYVLYSFLQLVKGLFMFRDFFSDLTLQEIFLKSMLVFQFLTFWFDDPWVVSVLLKKIYM